MSKFTQIVHRFAAAGLAGGFAGLVTFFGANTNITDYKKFGLSALIAFGTGFAFALEKAVQTDYPVITPVIPLVNNEIATVTSKLAPQATVLTSTTNVPSNVTTTTVLPFTTEQEEVAPPTDPVV